MIGITLSSEQVRGAPAEVRQWIEYQVATSLGLQRQPSVEQQRDHLASCGIEEVAAILSQIQGVLPAVNVFFELGRQGVPVAQAPIVAFRLPDIALHARLQNVGQVVSCLNLINEAYGRIRGDASGVFCAADQEGHCLVAAETQQNILRLWRNVVAGQQVAVSDPPVASAPSAPGSVSASPGSNGSQIATELPVAQ
ncbi:hypothetical protein PY365_31780 [Roseiarcaceae bacterium H3SJ34-1]|uniref:hypothetical protein n=1 Tax=Terripilifer ovatus TaxID=3032367 RepID=UPI003AB95A00|nr:hypothetical protein [Roseiarcaceae bacterium H3SJ34-1]